MRSPSVAHCVMCVVCAVCCSSCELWRVVACSCCETCLSLTLSLSSVSMCRCGALAPSFRKYRSLLKAHYKPLSGQRRSIYVYRKFLRDLASGQLFTRGASRGSGRSVVRQYIQLVAAAS